MVRFASGVFQFFAAFLDIFASAFHGMATGPKESAEEKCAQNRDLEVFFHTGWALHGECHEFPALHYLFTANLL